MSISDFQRKENAKELERLTNIGFEFEISKYGYKVSYKGTFIHGASILDVHKKMHWKHARENVANNIQSAIVTAKRSKYYTE